MNLQKIFPAPFFSSSLSKSKPQKPEKEGFSSLLLPPTQGIQAGWGALSLTGSIIKHLKTL